MNITFVVAATLYMPRISHKEIRIRNSDFCSELNAIDVALNAIKTVTSPADMWIFSKSRSALQHLSNSTKVGNKNASLSLKNLKELSQKRDIFLIDSVHIGFYGNEMADLLAKESATKVSVTSNTLTFSLRSARKLKS
ncbi:hypothetical protein TNCT_145171 [Trichonephila clavata]|uniref:RNase H type-1 domain-containing protein n=1 Tax=Trichonephila clavata TaxID=2740835 RepID=A0A8X6FQY9_TRICU|nr:hypothetical protein TNCT_145171 [Trichonephila clavata]